MFAHNPVVFLDIDGVLNITSASYTTAASKRNHLIEPHLVQRLEWFLKKTDASIVISSSWRYELNKLKEEMQKEGFQYWNRIIGTTSKSFLPYYRGEQIQKWLNEHPQILNYVVIDDNVSDICGCKCNEIPSENVVKVNPEIGLTHGDILQAMKIIK